MNGSPDAAPIPGAWPGPVPFGAIQFQPIPAVIDVKAHPTGAVQISMSSPDATMVVFIDRDAARKMSNDLRVAAAGMIIPN